MRGGEEIVRRARALIGTRFRPQGRGGDGLDCIGLAAAALRLAPGPARYRLRGGSPASLEEGLAAAGLEKVAAEEPGDLLVLHAGPAQLHLAIWSGTGIVHADAGLRRVVERPGAPDWPVIGTWRRKD